MIENWEQYKDLEYYPDRVCACGCGGRIEDINVVTNGLVEFCLDRIKND